jgi:hypothetical protein
LALHGGNLLLLLQYLEVHRIFRFLLGFVPNMRQRLLNPCFNQNLPL